MVPAIEKLKGENLNIKINKLIIYIFEISIINQNVETEPEPGRRSITFQTWFHQLKKPKKARI